MKISNNNELIIKKKVDTTEQTTDHISNWSYFSEELLVHTKGDVLQLILCYLKCL